MKNRQKIELTSSQVQLITEFDVINGTYYRIPFYFKYIEGRKYELLEEKDLPVGIQEYIKNKKK